MENGPNSRLAYSLSMKKKKEYLVAMTLILLWHGKKREKKIEGVRSSIGQMLFSVSKVQSKAVISPTDFNGITQTSGQTHT